MYVLYLYLSSSFFICSHFAHIFSFLSRSSIDGFVIRGSTLDGISYAYASLDPPPLLPTPLVSFVTIHHPFPTTLFPNLLQLPSPPFPYPVTRCRTEISVFMYSHDVSRHVLIYSMLCPGCGVDAPPLPRNILT